MNLRFHVDPATGEPHCRSHGIQEHEVLEVLQAPIEDWPAREGARIALGQTEAGRFVEVVYVPDPEPGSIFVITAYPIGPKALRALRRRIEEEVMSEEKLPPGWDEERVKRVLDYYEAQSDEDAAAEHDAAYEADQLTLVDVPVELLDEVRALIAKRRAG